MSDKQKTMDGWILLPAVVFFYRAVHPVTDFDKSHWQTPGVSTGRKGAEAKIYIKK